jgi:signal transduction histidine kinase
MAIEIIVLTFIVVVTTFLGYNVIRNFESGNKKQLLLFLILISQVIWTATILLTLIFFDVEGFNLWFSRSSFASAILISTSFYYFSHAYRYPNRSVNIYPFTIFLFNIFWIALSFTSFVLDSVEVQGSRLISNFGELQGLYSISLALIFIYSFYELFLSYKEAKDSNLRQQIKYIILGGLTSLIFSFISNLIIPLLGYEIRSLGPLFLMFFISGIVYAISRHRLLKLRVVIGSFLYFVIMSIIPFIIFIAISAFNMKLFTSVFDYRAMLIGIIIEAPIFTGLFLLCSKLIKAFLNETLIYVSYSPSKKRLEFIQRTNNELDLDKVIAEFNRTLATTVKPKVNDLVIYNTHAKKLKESLNIRNVFTYELLSQIIGNFNEKVVTYNEIEHKSINQSNGLISSILRIMEENHYEVLIIIQQPDSFAGIIALGNKSDLSAYDTNDLSFLDTLCAAYSVAIERTLLYLEKTNTERILKQKVHIATKKLRKQKKELQGKYQFEKDMMGIMGHELRTPLTVARGLAELLMSRINSGSIDQEYAKDKISKIYSSILKEAELVQMMLSTSHVDNNKLNLQISQFSLEDLVEYSYNAFKPDAEAKGLELIYTKPKFDVPLVQSDQNRLQEVINNLVSNAVKYTNQGHVKISFSQNGDSVIVNIEDTGIGIPKNELENVGKKFYRIHQHLDKEKQIVRSGGTGLGLYVVKGILKALGGELLIDSRVGRGSTFSAVIPVKSHFNDHVFITDKPVDKNDMFEQLGLKVEQKR